MRILSKVRMTALRMDIVVMYMDIEENGHDANFQGIVTINRLLEKVVGKYESMREFAGAVDEIVSLVERDWLPIVKKQVGSLEELEEHMAIMKKGVRTYLINKGMRMSRSVGKDNNRELVRGA